MIFLVDENFPGNTIAPLEQLAQSRHQFLKAGRDYPHGISDLELFSTAAAMDADRFRARIEGMSAMHAGLLAFTG